MAFYDVSVPLRPGMPLFEGDPPLHIERVSSLADGGICNLSRIEGSLHSGTHVDAPCHFIDGAGGVETIATEALMGPCVVVDATLPRGMAGQSRTFHSLLRAPLIP